MHTRRRRKRRTKHTRARGAHGNETIHTGESDTRTLTSGPEQSRSLADKTGKLVLTRRAAAYHLTNTHPHNIYFNIILYILSDGASLTERERERPTLWYNIMGICGYYNIIYFIITFRVRQLLTHSYMHILLRCGCVCDLRVGGFYGKTTFPALDHIIYNMTCVYITRCIRKIFRPRRQPTPTGW